MINGSSHEKSHVQWILLHRISRRWLDLSCEQKEQPSEVIVDCAGGDCLICKSAQGGDSADLWACKDEWYPVS